MESWLLKKSGGGGPAAAAGRARPHGEHQPEEPEKKKVKLNRVEGDPTVLACWNVQTLGGGKDSLLKCYEEEIREFTDTESPDVIFLSEVKLYPGTKKDGARVPWKQANVHCLPSDMNKKMQATALQEFKTVSESFTPGGAFEGYKMIKLSLNMTKGTTKPIKYAGTCMLIRMGAPDPIRVWTTLPESLADDPVFAEHDGEGRIILAEFATLMVLHTYTPNNGDASTADSPALKRRLDWDNNIREWLSSEQVLQGQKPIIYCGDLNVAPSRIDLTDPDKFAKPSQFVPVMGKKHEPADRPGDVGQPGCTPAERERFFQLLKEAELFDAYRALNPPAEGQTLDDALPQGTEAGQLWGNTFTWRGNENNGPYFKHGMRIDHFLLSNRLVDRLSSCTIRGKGMSCSDASFMGSDHCPMLCTLRPPTPK